MKLCGAVGDVTFPKESDVSFGKQVVYHLSPWSHPGLVLGCVRAGPFQFCPFPSARSILLGCNPYS